MLKHMVYICAFIFIIVCLENGGYFLVHSSHTTSSFVVLDKPEYRLGDSPYDESGVPVWTYLDKTPWEISSSTFLSRARETEEQYVWFKIKLPDAAWKHPYLYIYRVHDRFEVYSNNKLQYASSDLKPSQQSSASWTSHYSELDEELLGHDVFFRVNSNSRHLGFEPKIMIGTNSSVIRELFYGDLDNYAAGVILGFVGFLALFVFFRYKKEPSLLHLSLFSVSGGIIAVTEQVQTRFLWNTPVLDSYLHITAISFICVPFLSLVEMMYQKQTINNKVIRVLKQGAILLFFFVITLMCFDMELLDRINYHILFSVFVFVVFSILSVTLSLSLIKRTMDQELIILSYGVFVFLLINMKDHIDHLLHSFIFLPGRGMNLQPHPVQISLPWSLLCMMMTFSIFLYRRFSKISDQNKLYLMKLEEQNEELRELNTMKDDFLFKTSHALLAPLKGMIGVADSLIEGRSGYLDEVIKKSLSMIVISGKRLTNLVDGILDFTKLKYEITTLDRKAISLREIAELVILSCRTQLQGKPVKIASRIDPNVPLVDADEGRVQQIIYYLIETAIKSTNWGNIEISSKVIEGYVQIEIRDTGVGITPERCEIIESCVEADTQFFADGGGEEVGLVIAKHLVQSHGGDFHLISDLGAGTTVIFTLPIFSEPNGCSVHLPEEGIAADTYDMTDPAAEHNLPNDAGYSQKTFILIVDDEPINAQALLNFLSSEQYLVMFALSGSEAIELINKGFEPDLIISDIMMPQMSGFELSQRLRQMYSPRDLPIIMLASSNLEQDLAKGLDAGVNDYLVKPVSKQELLARIKMHTQLTKSNKNIELMLSERISRIRNMLDHAGQGFLQFEDDLQVQADYSRECLAIFGFSIEQYDFPRLICPHHAENQQFVRDLLKKLFHSQLKKNQLDTYLALLPDTYEADDLLYRIQYRFFTCKQTNKKICLVTIKDITQQRLLEQHLEKERQQLRMIVQVRSNHNLFCDYLQQYREYSLSLNYLIEGRHELLLEEVMGIYKTIHTFKGYFKSFHMHTSSSNIYEMEKRLYEFTRRAHKEQGDLTTIIDELKLFDTWIQKDMELLEEIFGETFLEQAHVSENETTSLKSISEVTDLNSKELLTLAREIGKNINPLVVTGADIEINVDLHRGISQILTHLLRNCIVHGIEISGERISRGKSPYGTIQCHFSLHHDNERLHCIIMDDGQGIREDLVNNIFEEGVTTSFGLNSYAGHGLGLSVVKELIERLNGSIIVITEPGAGTEMLIDLPYLIHDYSRRKLNVY
ncbi:ATP-binding protein [Paenibacillus sp. FSL R7-0337]|uniref:ATP-binding protein n=1 Tax=Paenibacillus sp. FSL R7-0337 TaxID=1926588 RepID=UPI00096C6B21|nr:ATP-binding protein [Paenibacillus sp. FSL R7-0337]OMF88998.1 hypothetical protein BK147_26230 [Paenibacillus sp. FSL R7-0337]